jgi:H+/Cl- antiporter ClcA
MSSTTQSQKTATATENSLAPADSPGYDRELTYQQINLGEGTILGIAGALVAIIFVILFRSIGDLTKYIEHHTIVLGTLGGLSIGLIALAFPQTLFFGEKEIETIIETGSTFGVAMLHQRSIVD